MLAALCIRMRYAGLLWLLSLESLICVFTGNKQHYASKVLFVYRVCLHQSTQKILLQLKAYAATF